MEASGSQPGPGRGRWGLTWTVGGLCSHAPPEAPVWGLPPRPGWGASVAEEEARARPPGEWPSLFPLGGDCVETVPGFLMLLSTPPSELVWSCRCPEGAGPRAAGGGQKAEGVATDPAVGARPSAEGPLQPLLQGDSHRPWLQNMPPVRGGAAFCLAPCFSAKRRRCLWLMGLLADPVSIFRGGLGSWVWGADKRAAR